jgi:beta-xylosidase
MAEATVARVARVENQRCPDQGDGTYLNPILGGDYPDPSIIRIGKDYWATATTSQWAPVFPILHSTDMVHWKTEGAVFSTPPEWAVTNYWAPEISVYKGRIYVYYSAKKKDGPLCVAVATAANPVGPYQDHGPMVCQDAGSIDAAPATDENGRGYLI